MVKPDCIKNIINKFEIDIQENRWTDIRKRQLQYLFNIYETGSFSSLSINQINQRLVTLFFQ